MPIRDPIWDRVLQKQKYFEKILSPDGFMSTWDRYFQQRDLLARIFWGDVPIWDFANLGIGLMYLIPPIDLEPLSIFHVMEWPSFYELDEGIWINFPPFDFSFEFPEFFSSLDFLFLNFNFEFALDFLNSLWLIGISDIGRYGISVYDPTVFREFLRSTLYKIRQKRALDITFTTEATILQEISNVHEQTDEVLEHRHEFLKEVQAGCFMLGLSPLGVGKLVPGENGYATITVSDAEGNPVQIKVSKLEELMFGLWLGIIPLGFGCVMPRETVFKFEDNKKMPKFFKYVDKKTNTILRQTPFTPWAYRNYHRVDESLSPHKSERTAQYHSFQEMRAVIENVVEGVVSPEEASATKIRQYKNAALQLISYPAKRHFWGYGAYKAMTDDEFYEYWLNYWQGQGLNRDLLIKIYEVIRPYLHNLREEKLRLGKKISEMRRNLAKSRESAASPP